jgi:hypothetical protein
MRDLVEERCYAGGRGDETPRAVVLGGREVTVRVERRWIEGRSDPAARLVSGGSRCAWATAAAAG